MVKKISIDVPKHIVDDIFVMPPSHVSRFTDSCVLPAIEHELNRLCEQAIVYRGKLTISKALEVVRRVDNHLRSMQFYLSINHIHHSSKRNEKTTSKRT